MRSINPTIKFISLVVMTFILAFKHDPVLNLVVFAVCMILIIATKRNLKVLLGLLIPIALIAFGLFMTGYRFANSASLPFNAQLMNITDSRVWNGMIQMGRVFAYAGLGLLYVLTTDRVEMMYSFKKQVHVPAAFAYGIMAAWGIFPQMSMEYKRTRAAFRARGINVLPVSPKILLPMLVKSIRWSDALATAMESKGFNGSAKRSSYYDPKIRFRDLIFLIVCCAVFSIFVFLIMDKIMLL